MENGRAAEQHNGRRRDNDRLFPLPALLFLSVRRTACGIGGFLSLKPQFVEWQFQVSFPPVIPAQ